MSVILIGLLILILLEAKVEFIIGYCVLVVMYLLYKNNNKVKESFEIPISYSNLMLNDLPQTEPVAKQENEKDEERLKRIKEYLDTNQETTLKNMYYDDVFRSSTDYFNKKSGYRQYYRTPEVSGDISSIYINKPSCKYNPEVCYPLEDTRTV